MGDKQPSLDALEYKINNTKSPYINLLDNFVIALPVVNFSNTLRPVKTPP